MNPAEAVQAHLDLGAAHSVVMHFGTFQLTTEAIDAPTRALDEACRVKSVEPMRSQVLEFGASARVPRSERWLIEARVQPRTHLNNKAVVNPGTTGVIQRRAGARPNDCTFPAVASESSPLLCALTRSKRKREGWARPRFTISQEREHRWHDQERSRRRAGWQDGPRGDPAGRREGGALSVKAGPEKWIGTDVIPGAILRPILASTARPARRPQ